MSYENEVATCRSCGASIEFVLTAKGKRMPLDLGPSRDGNVLVRLGHPPKVYKNAEEATKAMAALGIPFENLRISHFATCPTRKRR